MPRGLPATPGSAAPAPPSALFQGDPEAGEAADARAALAADLAGLLRAPGLVVLTGPPGSGRTAFLQTLADLSPGPVHAGGGLAALRTVPALALSRAVRARLPADDPLLLAEAVRSRVRGGLLVLDDVHLADPATLAALPRLAAHCRVAVALRTPHRLPADTVGGLRAAATAWRSLPPLGAGAAADLVRRAAPRLGAAQVAAVVHRAGGLPAVVQLLARHAATRPAPSSAEAPGTPELSDFAWLPPSAGLSRTAGLAEAAEDRDGVVRAVAAALADLDRGARTALAALGLLGRPAPAAVLTGAAPLLAAGLAVADPAGLVAPVSGYVAEVAAGLLDDDTRRGLHRRLAAALPPAEAARHLAAAGDTAAAYRAALSGADAAATGGERADALLFACALSGIPADPRVRVAAADAALAAGRPDAAARVLTTVAPLGVEADALRGEALLQAGDVAAARAAVRPIPDAAPWPVVAGRDRVLVLADLHTDPDVAAGTAERITARLGGRAAPPGLAAALAAVRAAARAPGWEGALAAAARAPGDPLAARWSAWLLVTHLMADGRLRDAAAAAHAAADASAADLAYSWQTRFLGAALLAAAVRAADPLDDVLRRAADLTDRALPADAHAAATAAAALVEADTGQLTAARHRLAGADPAAPAVAWVTREAAWLDGQPGLAADRPAGDDATFFAGLRAITARWAAHDGAAASHDAALQGSDDVSLDAPLQVSDDVVVQVSRDGALPVSDNGPRQAGGGGCPGSRVPAVRGTLAAWDARHGFAVAADAWPGIAVREQVRCLLAEGDHQNDSAAAVRALATAESLADGAGLVVLAGRARRGLRRHRVHRDVRGARTDGVALTEREEVVLGLVAEGSPTRRIAGQLGVSAETVETHIKTAMRKLGARTRTEAAARAAAHWAAGPRAAESGAAGTATADSAAPRSAPGGSAVGSAARGSTAAAGPARRAVREDR